VGVAGGRSFNSLSRDHEPGVSSRSREDVTTEPAFNSLSRDHGRFGDSHAHAKEEYFQLPLSGSHDGGLRGQILSDGLAFQLPLSGSPD